ncbi:MAG TPA: hypothetical protein VHT97_04380 [Acidimicrobiales bacterium]|nr:hypothetical protein [Acidimicrobiales bacterium]
MLLLLPAVAVQAASVDLDPSFGTGGIARVDLGHASVEVAKAIGDPNIAVGSANGNMAVAGFPGSGWLANDGRATIDFGKPSVAYAVGTGPDHAVVVAGSAGDDFARARLDSRDGSFLSSVTTSFGGPAVARALVAPNLSNVAIGQATVGGVTGVAMARYDTSDQLDSSFGTGGKVFDDITPGVDGAFAAATLDAPGPRILVAGQAGGSLLLARYMDDGSRDLSFGTGGHVVVDLSTGDDVARAVYARDGKIVVAGSAGGRGMVAQFAWDGALDPSFGNAGVVLSDLATTPAGFTALAVDNTGSSNQIDVAGTITGPGGQDAVVAAYDATGSVVTSFGKGGQAIVDLGSGADTVAGLTFGGPVRPRPLVVAGDDGADFVQVKLDAAGAVVPQGSSTRATVDFGHPSPEGGVRAVVQPDGKIVAAGLGGSGLLLMRFLPDGRVDPSFRPGHPDVPEAGAVSVTDLALQPGGGIVVAATNGGLATQWVVRFTADGVYDPTFGGMPEGRVPVNSGGLAVQPDGRILMAGGPRLDASGHLDPTYTSTQATPRAVGVVVLPDGRSVVAGRDPSPYLTVQLTGYLADGTTDPSFQRSSAVDTRGAAAGLARLPDGRLVTVGTSNPFNAGPSQNTHVILAAYDAHGLPDVHFGTGDARLGTAGTVVSGFAPYEHASSVLAQPDGKILVVAWASVDPQSAPNNELEVLRYTGDGHLDRSFGRGGAAIVQWHGITGSGAALQPDGKVVVPTTLYDGPDGDLGLARYDPAPTSTRTPRAFGWNAVGQLGDGTVTDRSTPVAVTGLSGVVSVSAGAYHSLALRSDGTVWSWGWNPVGQLGDGTTVDRHSPVRVAGLTGVTAIAAGTYHDLALKNDGTVWAWGSNNEGEVGDGSTVTRLAPVQVAGLTGVKAIAAGAYHSLALTADGNIWAWGWNALGQLGDGTTVDRHLPVRLSPMNGVTAIAAGAFHSLALFDTGQVAAWGWNGFGQLGIAAVDDAPRPLMVGQLDGVQAIAAGGLHNLALKSDGTVWSWGWNGVGQLGDGTVTDRQVPVQAAGLTGVVSIAAGTYDSLALEGDGTVAAWGWNGTGQLGTGTTTDRHAPTPVPGAAGAIAIAGGGLHTVIA